MNSKLAGDNILEVEVTHISLGGIWVLTHDKEYFLPFEKFPIFRDATVAKIHNVRLERTGYLNWPGLNLEVALESLGNPATVPHY